jgi:nitrate/TMAO reductase-like tetraheme cytochrome c subunit
LLFCLKVAAEARRFIPGCNQQGLQPGISATGCRVEMRSISEARRARVAAGLSKRLPAVLKAAWYQTYNAPTGESSMSPRRIRYGTAAFAALTLVLTAGAVAHQTQKTSFCMSCHEMQSYQKEVEASPHAGDARGQPIGCGQCHVPNENIARMLAGKIYLGTTDVWSHFADGGYNLDRAAMQPLARRFVDDANCRACHEDLNKNAKNNGPVSEEGKLAHDAFLGKNGRSRSGCVGCHANMAHLPPFDARIPRNAKFLSQFKEIQP